MTRPTSRASRTCAARSRRRVARRTPRARRPADARASRGARSPRRSSRRRTAAAPRVAAHERHRPGAPRAQREHRGRQVEPGHVVPGVLERAELAPRPHAEIEHARRAAPAGSARRASSARASSRSRARTRGRSAARSPRRTPRATRPSPLVSRLPRACTARGTSPRGSPRCDRALDDRPRAPPRSTLSAAASSRRARAPGRPARRDSPPASRDRRRGSSRGRACPPAARAGARTSTGRRASSSPAATPASPRTHRYAVTTRCAGESRHFFGGRPRSTVAEGTPCSFMSKTQAPSGPPLPRTSTPTRTPPRLPVPAIRQAASITSSGFGLRTELVVEPTHVACERAVHPLRDRWRQVRVALATNEAPLPFDDLRAPVEELLARSLGDLIDEARHRRGLLRQLGILVERRADVGVEQLAREVRAPAFRRRRARARRG